LTHIVYGRPLVPRDDAAVVLLVDMTRSANSNVLCRLHGVIENLSDL
jgi:hypothetical protein